MEIRLFLILAMTMSYFWEGDYAIQSLFTQSGDDYLAGEAFLGKPKFWWVLTGGALGPYKFALAVAPASRALARHWDMGEALRLARLYWISSSIETTMPPPFYQGGPGKDLFDSLTEIAVASACLLIIPARVLSYDLQAIPLTIPRRPILLGLAGTPLAFLNLTLGKERRILPYG